AAALRQSARGPLGDLGDLVLHGDRGGDARAGGPALLGGPLGTGERVDLHGDRGRADAVGETDTGLVGEHLAGDDEDGPDASVGGGPQRHPHVVGGAQPADDGDAEAGALAEVLEVDAALGAVQHALDPGAGLLVEADAGVLELDGDAGLDLGGGDVHLGLRRRVAGGVVEEFGRGVDDGLDGDALDVDLGDRLQVDAAVLQDAGHRAAQHAVERGGLGPLASGAAAAEDGDGVGEAADQGGAVVDAQQVVEDLGVAAVVLLHLAEFFGLLVDDGLHAAGDADEGPGGGVPQGFLVVDDPQHDAQQPDLVLRQVAPGGVQLGQVADHLVGRVAAVQVVQCAGGDLLREVQRLRVVGGDARLQIRTVTLVLGARVPQDTAAACGLRSGGDHQRGGDGAADAAGGPGGFRRQGGGGSGRRGHQYRREQQDARVRRFAATGRGLDTHQVGPLEGIGWWSGGGAGNGLVSDCGNFTQRGTGARIHPNWVRCGRA